MLLICCFLTVLFGAVLGVMHTVAFIKTCDSWNLFFAVVSFATAAVWLKLIEMNK
jgi:hypothetical protein